MRAVTVIRSARVQALEYALRTTVELVHFRSITECTVALEMHRPEAAIADPVLFTIEELQAFAKLLRAAQIPLLFYADLEPEVVQLVLPVIAQQSTEFLVANVNGSGACVREALDALPRRSLRADLFASVTGAISQLPVAVAAAMATVLLDPTWISAKELPARFRVSRRTIDRALYRNKCAPLQQWCTVSRLVAAVERLRDPLVSLHCASRAAGYSDARSLQRVSRSVLGPGAELRLRKTSRAEFLSVVSRVLAQRDRDRGSDLVAVHQSTASYQRQGRASLASDL